MSVKYNLSMNVIYTQLRRGQLSRKQVVDVVRTPSWDSVDINQTKRQAEQYWSSKIASSMERVKRNAANSPAQTVPEPDRLSEGLEILRTRLGELQRKELDRQAYEGQARELVERINELEIRRAYREQLRRQSEQTEQLRNRQATLVDNQNIKHQQPAKQVQMLPRQPSHTKKASSEEQLMSRDIQAYKLQISALMGRIAQLQVRHQTTHQKLNLVPEYQKKIGVYSDQIQRLNGVILSLSNNLHELSEKKRVVESECAQMRQKAAVEVELRRKLAEYEQRIRALSEEIERGRRDNHNKLDGRVEAAEVEGLRRKVKELTESNRRLPDYEKRIVTLTNEIDRLNHLRQQKDEMILTSQSLKASIKSPFLTQQQSPIHQRLYDSGALDHKECELRISQANKEAEKLNIIIEWLRNQACGGEHKMKEVMKENQELRAELKNKVKESRDSMKVGSDQRFLTLSKEIERLNIALVSKEQARKSLQESTGKFISQIAELKGFITQLHQQNDAYKKTSPIQPQKLAQQQRKLSIFSQQIERLNIVLQNKNYQIGALTKKLSEAQSSSNNLAGFELQKAELARLNNTLNEKLRVSEEKCKDLVVTASKNADLCEELKARLSKIQAEKVSQSPPTVSKADQQNKEYEKKISILSHEIERLNILIEGKNKDILVFQQIVCQLENNRSAQRQRKSSAEATAQPNLTSSNPQKKIAFLTSQLDRLTVKLKQTQTQRTQADEKYLSNLKQTEVLKARLAQYEDKYSLSQKRVEKISKQFEKLNNIIGQLKKENMMLKQSNFEMELKIKQTLPQPNEALSTELERLTRLLEQRDQELGDLRIRYADNASMMQRIKEHLALFVVLFAQIESLRQRLLECQTELQAARRSSTASFRRSQGMLPPPQP